MPRVAKGMWKGAHGNAVGNSIAPAALVDGRTPSAPVPSCPSVPRPNVKTMGWSREERGIEIRAVCIPPHDTACIAAGESPSHSPMRLGVRTHPPPRGDSSTLSADSSPS